MTPDVSVIITSYNTASYIHAATHSALNQQGVSVEVIIVDDASTDNSWQAILTLTDPRVKRLRLDANSGPGAARNEAIKLATGTWIAVLDSDDIFLPGRLERCLLTAKTNQADIVIDNLLVLREDDGSKRPMFSPEHFIKLDILDLATFIKGTLSSFDNYTLGYTKPIFSREFINKYGLSYPIELRIGEDYIFLARALALGARCAVEPTIGYRYTARKGSISHRLKLSDIVQILDADNKYIKAHPLEASAAKAQRKREHLLLREYGFTLLVSALKTRNIPAILHAITRHPNCLWQLYRPILVRLKRMGGTFP